MDLRVLGSRLRRLRESRGMSLRGLAAAAGLAPSFLSDVERGRTRPSLDSLATIAGALGVSLHDLFDPVAAPAGPLDLRRALRDPAVPVAYAGRPLTPGERDKLLRILDAALALRPDGGQPFEPPDVVSLAAHMEAAYGRPPSPELLRLIRTVVQEVREELGARRRRGERGPAGAVPGVTPPGARRPAGGS